LSKLRAHQIEPVDNLVRYYTARPGQDFPVTGLRGQLIAACGSGKTFMSAHTGIRVAHSGSILVLVPTLDLLGQTIRTWRAAGRLGEMYAVCSLEDNEPAIGVRCTTSATRLSFWLSQSGPVTVFATYSSLSTIIDAHRGTEYVRAATAWDLLIVDEAHRTSGDAGKAWAEAHNNNSIPAARRLYMTATPRVWNIPDEKPDEKDREPGYKPLQQQYAASMDDEAIFGPVIAKLSLSRCIELGILAQYQIVAVEITDPVLHDLLGKPGEKSDSAREARLASLQVALLKAMKKEKLQRVISFHNRLSDAEVFSATLNRRTITDDHLSRLYPNGVWSRWLGGEHKTEYRRAVLAEFEDGTVERPAVLSNVKVLTEGVDTTSDAVIFTESRGSIVDLVQAVGRALRQKPGAGKIAQILVPVIVRKAGSGTVEDAAGGGMISDPAWRPLIEIMQALRAHDADVIDGLAVPQQRSRTTQNDPYREDQGDKLAEDGKPIPRPVLKFASGDHTAEEVAAAVRLRLLSPEAQTWLRGYAAAMRWHQAHGDLAVPANATEPNGTFPLGRWIRAQREAYTANTILPSRQDRLNELGMVWSAHEAAWQAGFVAARTWAEVHGHLCAPTRSMWDGTPVGRWLTDQRRAAALPADAPGALSEARRAALAGVDPWWNPVWPVAWQRVWSLALAHVEAGGSLAELPAGHLVAGEDLGRWVADQRAGWVGLGAERQEMMGWLKVDPPAEAEAPVAPVRGTTQADRFAAGVEAAAAYRAREGGIHTVPRSHQETLSDGTVIKLGVWLTNTRGRKAKLSAEHVAALDALGMRW